MGAKQRTDKNNQLIHGSLEDILCLANINLASQKKLHDVFIYCSVERGPP